MPIVWVESQARYRDTDTGRFVSRDTVLDYVRQSIESSGEVTKTLAERVSSGQLSSREFLTVFKQEIKDEYIRQYVAGRGGLGSMTQQDWGELGSMIKEQYNYANNFATEISGLSEAQIVNQAGMYIEAANQAFEAGYRKAVTTSGNFSEERWVLGGSAEPCSDCTGYAAMGWQPLGTIPTLPGAGATKCKSRCQCHMEYR